MKFKDFKHPELEDGEVFLSNHHHSTYHKVGWKSKRAGTTPYDAKDKPMIGDGVFPVFVQRAELEKRGIEIQGKYNVDLEI